MHRKPKYDQFQSKGNHNEENPQSTTKMPGNPKFDIIALKQVIIALKQEKSTNCNHNLINSEGGQDTSAFKISGHLLNGFSRKCQETPNLTHITVKIVPKLEKSPDCDYKLISSEDGQDTSAYTISGHSLHAFSGKCPVTPNLTRFTKSK